MDSSNTLPPCVPLPLEEGALMKVIEGAKDFAVTHGIGMRYKDRYDEDSLFFAPFVLFPSVFPKKEFKEVLDIQTTLNELMHKIAHDSEFLSSALSSTIQTDEFTKRLFQIHETVNKEGITQALGLGILRSDYMNCLVSSLAAKQIEINTIASSFGALTSRLIKLHKFVLTELGHHDLVKNLPPNNALHDIAHSMVRAVEAYGTSPLGEGTILFIVEDVTYNICDQRLLQFEIQSQNPKIKIIRRTLAQVHQTGRLGASRKELLIDGEEISLVYFRCGYAPTQYPSEDEWKARLLMERSLAIKCPNVSYHLAGTKKVQQELSLPGVLEKFFPGEESKVARIRKFFAGLYPLDFSPKGNESYEMVMKSPEKFVLKPQREGGGNNVYGKDIKDFLLGLQDPKERNAYILMDRIWPPITSNYLIVSRKKKFEVEDCVSELGIFGCILGSKDSVLFNEQSGHMLRTKSNSSNEGGVASGSGALDSVLLLDIQRKGQDSNADQL